MRKDMIVKIHSVSELAMNSSGNVYFIAKEGYKEKAFEMLNAVLQIAGSDRKAEDLFDVYTYPNMGYVLDIIDDRYHSKDYDIFDEDVLNNELKELFSEYEEETKNMKDRWEYKREKFRQFFIKNSEKIRDFLNDSDMNYDDEFYIVPKNKDQDANLMDYIFGMIDAEYYYS